MYNRTATDWFMDKKEIILNLSPFRWIDIGASVLFLLLIAGGRKVWLNFLSLMIFFEGVQNIVFPKAMNFWVTGELDDTHLLLIRYLGLLCVTWSLTYFLIGKSTDSTTETSFLLSCSVMTLTSLLARGYLITHLPKQAAVKIEYEPMTTIFYMTLLSTVATVFYTFKANDWGGYGEQRSHANSHQRVQFIQLLFMGVILYALPQWTVKIMGPVEKVDTVHAFFARAFAGLLLSNAIMCTRSANFLRNSDRDAVIFSQWLFIVSAVALGWINAAGRLPKMEWSQIALCFFHGAFFILNATGAMNRDFSVIKRVVIPRFKAIPQDIRGLFKFKRL